MRAMVLSTWLGLGLGLGQGLGLGLGLGYSILEHLLALLLVHLRDARLDGHALRRHRLRGLP